jgi:hypothetical protein
MNRHIGCRGRGAAKTGWGVNGILAGSPVRPTLYSAAFQRITLARYAAAWRCVALEEAAQSRRKLVVAMQGHSFFGLHNPKGRVAFGWSAFRAAICRLTGSLRREIWRGYLPSSGLFAA